MAVNNKDVLGLQRKLCFNTHAMKQSIHSYCYRNGFFDGEGDPIDVGQAFREYGQYELLDQMATALNCTSSRPAGEALQEMQFIVEQFKQCLDHAPTGEAKDQRLEDARTETRDHLDLLFHEIADLQRMTSQGAEKWTDKVTKGGSDLPRTP